MAATMVNRKLICYSKRFLQELKYFSHVLQVCINFQSRNPVDMQHKVYAWGVHWFQLEIDRNTNICFTCNITNGKGLFITSRLKKKPAPEPSSLFK